METELRKTIETAIDKHYYDFLFSYLKNISPANYREICNYMISYIQRNHNSSSTFWELAQRCSDINFPLSKAFLLRENLKGIKINGKRFKNIFHTIFSEYCQKDNNVNDILQLMKLYAQMFDIPQIRNYAPNMIQKRK